MTTGQVTILGIFAADMVFRAARLPLMGETLPGSGFALGCGGKGSNQAVAARRCGAPTHFISRIGQDVFGDMAMRLWTEAGIGTAHVTRVNEATGAAFIYVNENNGDNAIIVASGAAAGLGVADAEAAAPLIRSSAVFATQLEQPLAVAIRGLEIARSAGVLTVLNPAPAPATALPAALWQLCDLVTPNESEATAITGITVTDDASALAAAGRLRDRGARSAMITLGARGALLHSAQQSIFVDAIHAGSVVDTTGAGDAFNGGLFAALAAGLGLEAAARFATVAAGLSVTREGAAASMPARDEIDRFMKIGS